MKLRSLFERLFAMRGSLVFLALAVGAVFVFLPTARARAPTAVPPPAIDAPAGGSGDTQTAVLAGGCFWGVQGVFQHVAGVKSVVSGYAGGSAETASYERVEGGKTAHAEAVRIVFDPAKISYGQLLQIYFSVAHDPTHFNRQGPDHGPQYRSAVFASNAGQSRFASAYIDQLTRSNTFGKALVTTVESDRIFYPAETYHQDYMTLNPGNPYVVVNELPKIENLKRMFPLVYRATPVLVLGGRKLI